MPKAPVTQLVGQNPTRSPEPSCYHSSPPSTVLQLPPTHNVTCAGSSEPHPSAPFATARTASRKPKSANKYGNVLPCSAHSSSHSSTQFSAIPLCHVFCSFFGTLSSPQAKTLPNFNSIYKKGGSHFG